MIIIWWLLLLLLFFFSLFFLYILQHFDTKSIQLNICLCLCAQLHIKLYIDKLSVHSIKPFNHFIYLPLSSNSRFPLSSTRVHQNLSKRMNAKKLNHKSQNRGHYSSLLKCSVHHHNFVVYDERAQCSIKFQVCFVPYINHFIIARPVNDGQNSHSSTPLHWYRSIQTSILIVSHYILSTQDFKMLLFK